METMDQQANGIIGLKREEVRSNLFSSSTKRRISELHTLNSQIQDNGMYKIFIRSIA